MRIVPAVHRASGPGRESGGRVVLWWLLVSSTTAIPLAPTKVPTVTRRILLAARASLTDLSVKAPS